MKIFTIIGIITVIGFMLNIIVKEINKYNKKKERNKYKDWLEGYDYETYDIFSEHYRWCEYGSHYFDSREDYNCICYAR